MALAVAAVVATCNALSSAQLAAVHPSSGGTYVYGRRQLGPFWGHLAGFGFVVGKTASCAAMALAVGSYAAPSLAQPLAVAAVVVTLTAVNLRGVAKTARLSRVLVVAVLAVLALVVVGCGDGDLGVVRYPLDGVCVAHRLGDGAVVALVLLVDLRGAIGFSSFAVLVYYAVANASALTLGAHQRRYPRAVPVVGLVGCVVLAATLPLSSVVAGAGVLAAGSLAFGVRRLLT